MNLYLIRHTKVTVKSDICYGQTDVKLARSFQKEKKKIASRVKEISFDKVYSSPLTRCKKLAEAVLSDVEIVFDERLMELNFGDWEMQTWDKIYASPEGKEWMDNYQKLPTRNGESYPEMVKRINSFFDDVVSENTEDIAIFTHAGVIRILKSIIENRTIEELFSTFKPEYGSVLKLVI
jgi:alpha-ribazole phosphatase